MDFGTVLTKLDAKKYSSIAKFEEDVELIFTNCCQFNSDGSEIYNHALQLQAQFRSMIAVVKRAELGAR